LPEAQPNQQQPREELELRCPLNRRKDGFVKDMR